jgi:Tol biopolymer transport system component
MFADQVGSRITTATINVHGKGLRKIPLPKGLNLGPGAWSPSGRQIAFQGWDDAKSSRDGIYIGNASNAGDLRLVAKAGHSQVLPGDFSPDGTQLAFFRGPNNSENAAGSIWVINLNGTGLRRVTPKGMPVDIGTLDWSPDGKSIVFASTSTAPKGALWTIHPDGTHLHKLFQRNGQWPITPTWSPNGTQIMFALDKNNSEDSWTPNGLYVIGKNGRQLRLAIGGNNFKREPDWVR